MTCKLTSDGQLLDLLRASQRVKLLMIVGRCEEGDERLGLTLLKENVEKKTR